MSPEAIVLFASHRLLRMSTRQPSALGDDLRLLVRVERKPHGTWTRVYSDHGTDLCRMELFDGKLGSNLFFQSARFLRRLGVQKPDVQGPVICALFQDV